MEDEEDHTIINLDHEAVDSEDDVIKTDSRMSNQISTNIKDNSIGRYGNPTELTACQGVKQKSENASLTPGNQNSNISPSLTRFSGDFQTIYNASDPHDSVDRSFQYGNSSQDTSTDPISSEIPQSSCKTSTITQESKDDLMKVENKNEIQNKFASQSNIKHGVQNDDTSTEFTSIAIEKKMLPDVHTTEPDRPADTDIDALEEILEAYDSINAKSNSKSNNWRNESVLELDNTEDITIIEDITRQGLASAMEVDGKSEVSASVDISAIRQGSENRTLDSLKDPQENNSTELNTEASSELVRNTMNQGLSDIKLSQIQGGVDRFHEFFPSTDSESDCDRLVVDLKSQDNSDLEESISQNTVKKSDKHPEEKMVIETATDTNLEDSKVSGNFPSRCVSDPKILEPSTNAVSPIENPNEFKDTNSEANQDIQNDQKIPDEENSMHIDEISEFAPMISLGGIQHISAEEFERMGKEYPNESEDIDPSEIQSVPVGNLQNENKSVPVEKLPTESQSVPVEEQQNVSHATSLQNDPEAITSQSCPAIDNIKIKLEPVDNGYEIAAKKLYAASHGQRFPTFHGHPRISTFQHQQQMMLQRKAVPSSIVCRIVKPNDNRQTAPLTQVHLRKPAPSAASLNRKRGTVNRTNNSATKISSTAVQQIKHIVSTTARPTVSTPSFGVQSVTKMMQRKHKIGNHKAPPLSPHYRKYLLSYSPSACLECGDSFTTKDTYNLHMQRCSITITYQCPKCCKACVFYNKCAFLSHIRYHNKQQAASKNPAIQVKADILKISMAPRDKILKSLEYTFEPIKTIPIPDMPVTCSECQTALDNEVQLALHFGCEELICTFNFVCNTCNMVMPSKCALEAHKRYHAMKPPFTCPECGWVLPVFEEFRDHIKSKCLHFSRSALLQCNVDNSCKHREIRISPMKKHLFTNHVRNVYNQSVTTRLMCQVCFKYITGKERAEDHMLTHLLLIKRNATFAYVCNCCSEAKCAVFANKELLRSHMIKTHSAATGRTYPCCACNKILESYSVLLAHQLQVHELISLEFYYCYTCKVMLENPILMERHTCRSETPPNFLPPPNNSVVSKKSPTLANITKVVKVPIANLIKVEKNLVLIKPKQIRKMEPKPIVAPPPPQKLECSICQMEFKSKEEIVHHNQSEHSSYPCHLCGLTYDSRFKLDEHCKTTHEGEKPGYFCISCKKKGIKRTFHDANFLERHLLNKHKVSKARVYRFVAIGKESTLTSKSTKHKISLEPEATTEHVKRLRTEESGEYTCVKCRFSTPDSTEFSKHIETHKTVEAIQCPECGLCFSVMPSLKKHLFMVHKIKNAQEYIISHEIKELPELEMDSDSDDDLDIESPRKKSLSEIKPIETVRKNDGPVGELECRVCYREFENVTLLKNHMRVHGMAFIRSRRVAPSSSEIKPESETT